MSRRVTHAYVSPKIEALIGNMAHVYSAALYRAHRKVVVVIVMLLSLLLLLIVS